MSPNQISSWQLQQSQEREYIAMVPERVSKSQEQNSSEALLNTQAELLSYRQLYDHLPCICFALDTTGVIISVNQFGAESLGYSAEDLIQQSIFQLFADFEQKRLAKLLKDCSPQLPVTEGVDWEFSINCPKSKIGWVKIVLRSLREESRPHLLSVALPAPANNPHPILLMVWEDITVRKSAEAALKESHIFAPNDEIHSLHRLKEEFLSTVSHELRTPLTNMKMAIQMLNITLKLQADASTDTAGKTPEKVKASRYFQILNNECDREINLINNFLDLQKLDTDAKPVVLETIRVKPWLNRVVELFQARNPNLHSPLHLNIPDLVTPLICDPFSLERILVELLTNAYRFSPPDSQVIISATLKCRTIQFQVTNTGVEINAKQLKMIFDKFYRIPSTDPWKQGGTGLGLALVQKLTNYLGGSIDVESGGNLTRFILELPLRNE
ncbi:PAS domain-containing sensor histidine kinase [Calothrix sp. PCC 6303]|uniref:PAS domain-containing sensor histidine kinase n=1 Tax=Calothrix sp. PCC 6303 TaxID=1170562 RepID=UPI0002A0361A|nr:PAS domain-containing sensor histidine kinase [Calothrix sp. PCC 6303]AFZ02132.1 PAS/PAC sensor signal transduction histidine kinase [Calothrix sp. PCC 6303]